MHAQAPQQRQTLFAKYAVVFGGLICALLLGSSLVDLWFSFLENRAAVYQAERQQARTAGERIADFVKDIDRQISWAVPPPGLPDATSIEVRDDGYHRLLKQVPAITDIRYLDRDGKEQLFISRIRMKVVGSGSDFSTDPRFTAPIRDTSFFGPVDFPNGSEPYMSIAFREQGGAVTAVEVNLKLIQDLISEFKIPSNGSMPPATWLRTVISAWSCAK
jgi:two-component system, NtrC family, sensor kinase